MICPNCGHEFTVGGLTDKQLAQANAKVDAMLGASLKMKYPHRDKIPDQYLGLCDVYCEATGQHPTKRELNLWLMDFSDLMDANVTPALLRQAWEYSQKEARFIVSHPGALLKTAVGLRSQGHFREKPKQAAANPYAAILENMQRRGE